MDVGGESTRPGAVPVALEEELARVIPVVKALAAKGIAVSVDTMKPEVMRAAAEAGCAMLNDVNGFLAPGALEAAAASGAAICAMHMQGTPATMQAEPRYGDVVCEVRDFLAGRARELECPARRSPRAHRARSGLRLGKNFAHNVALVKGLGAIAALGYPRARGPVPKAHDRRDHGSRGGGTNHRERCGVFVAVRMAAIVRVHDVLPTVDALKVWAALR